MGMQKILIIGNGPLPEEKSFMHVAAGLRTEQFWQGLTRHFKDLEIEVDLRLIKIDVVGEFFDKANCSFTDEKIASFHKDDLKLKIKIPCFR